MPRDILVFMSDQHNATIMESAADPYVATPNMTRLAAEGVEYPRAYTSCPVCVPARLSMLTGQLPSRTGIWSNWNVLSSEQSTFTHCLGAEGYETVLCGRMHFGQQDQMHGFVKRPIGDFTPTVGGRGQHLRDDLGPYATTPSGNVTKHYGGGTSPVLEYDRAVTAAALDYLSQPHDRPVFLVVGIYGPHHTYVAPLDLYRKYLDLIGAPASDSVESFDLHAALSESGKPFTADEIHRMRAAYYGMVEHVDGLVGQVRDAWDAHLARTGREGLFCYLSDHGDMLGEKGLWFKQKFYEGSARIPLIFTGSDVARGVRVDSPVSIMDLGPTLCEYVGTTPPPDQDGRSLVSSLTDGKADDERYVLSESKAHGTFGRMVRYRQWKLVSYAGMEADDQLFDLASDPGEYTNVIGDNPAVLEKMRAMVSEPWEPEAYQRDAERREPHLKILARWGANSGVDEPYRWPVPESSWELPTR
jgi:choline-sulfatase